MLSHIKLFLVVAILLESLSSCKKLVNIPEPKNTVTTNETFNTSANATSAVTAIYSKMSSSTLSYSNGATTIYAGLAADELSTIGGGGAEFQINEIAVDNGVVQSVFWSNAYFTIYQANAVLDGLNSSSALPATIKKQLTGEAKFLRAFAYLNLVNLFGDVPLSLSISWETSSLLPRTSTDKVYEQIIADLKDAESLLPSNYDFSNGERIRATSWAAMALLARVYLYRGNWQEAFSLSNAVIANASLYSLPSDLNQVFLANSPEAILQLQPPNAYPYATVEGNAIVPPDTFSSANFTLTDQLLNDFEPGDLRRANWVGTTDFSGTYYYFPYKYKVYVDPSSTVTEYYMLLRLAEQFLIRAEANYNLGKLTEAIADLNVIRNRAGLTPLDNSLTNDQVQQAIVHERRIELFAEFGHRWFDLKRTHQATTVLQPLKSTWTPAAELWPIPFSELRADPNLTQNPGY